VSGINSAKIRKLLFKIFCL